MNDSNNEEDEGKELLKLSQPIYFEPISSLTNVFFDVDNQQIFCVRSNGVNIKIKFYFSKKLYLFWPHSNTQNIIFIFVLHNSLSFKYILIIQN